MLLGPRRKEDALSLGELAKDLKQEVGGLISEALSKTGGMAEYQAELKHLREEEKDREMRSSMALDQGTEAPAAHRPEVQDERLLDWRFLNYFNHVYLPKMEKMKSSDFKPMDDIRLEFDAKFTKFVNDTLSELKPGTTEYPSMAEMHERFMDEQEREAKHAKPESIERKFEVVKEEVNAEKRFLDYFDVYLQNMRKMGATSFKSWEELRREHQINFNHFVDKTLASLGPNPKEYPSIGWMHREFLLEEGAERVGNRELKEEMEVQELDSELLKEERMKPAMRGRGVRRTRGSAGAKKEAAA